MGATGTAAPGTPLRRSLGAGCPPPHRLVKRFMEMLTLRPRNHSE